MDSGRISRLSSGLPGPQDRAAIPAEPSERCSSTHRSAHLEAIRRQRAMTFSGSAFRWPIVRLLALPADGTKLEAFTARFCRRFTRQARASRPLSHSSGSNRIQDQKPARRDDFSNGKRMHTTRTPRRRPEMLRSTTQAQSLRDAPSCAEQRAA